MTSKTHAQNTMVAVNDIRNIFKDAAMQKVLQKRIETPQGKKIIDFLYNNGHITLIKKILQYDIKIQNILKHDKAYYQDHQPLIEDHQYDNLYARLKAEEKAIKSLLSNL